VRKRGRRSSEEFVKTVSLLLRENRLLKLFLSGLVLAELRLIFELMGLVWVGLIAVAAAAVGG
jgi:hypothetical protein